MQNILFKPICYVLLELGRYSAAGKSLGLAKVVKQVCLGLLRNPLVIMAFLGIVWNKAFGTTLLHTIDGLFLAPGNAFACGAPFLIGMGVVGKGELLLSASGFGISLFLTLVKSFLSPLIARYLLQPLLFQTRYGHGMIDEAVGRFVEFVFLYAPIPTAASSVVIAYQFFPPSCKDGSPRTSPQKKPIADTLASAALFNLIVSAPVTAVLSSFSTPLLRRRLKHATGAPLRPGPQQHRLSPCCCFSPSTSYTPSEYLPWYWFIISRSIS
jgi:hypothetical protein